MLVADLDHFKHVSDQHGDPAGDTVLRNGAYACARRCARPRLPDRGEAFVVLLAGADLEPALEISNRLRTAVAVRDAASAETQPRRLRRSGVEH